jgi:2-oxoisovalerate dehydrogenase E2 component (dihydrolipoyl transacylase)
MGQYLFRLPDVGEGTVEAEIVAWHVKPGDRVEEDQPLVDVMTDKATVEITSPVAGVVASIAGAAGDMAAVGATLVVFDTAGEGARKAVPAELAEVKPVVELEAVAQAMSPAPDMLGEGDYQFRLPDVGEGTVEAEIVAWHVQPGQDVEEDQPLVDVMTDKATVEITSPVAGRVVSIAGQPGQMAAVGSTLVVFSTGGVAVDAPRQEIAPIPAPAGDLSRAPAFHHRGGEKPTASPAVRRRAHDLGITLVSVTGTGPGGRILREDLEAHAEMAKRPATAPKPAAPAPAPPSGDRIEEIRIIGLRRKIAEKMQEAKRRIPHFAYIEEVDVTELEDLRAHLNATKAAERPKLTLLPFLIIALVRALPKYPQINARYDDEAGVLRRYGAVHLGMATQTDNGLIVPVIRNAEQRDVWALAAEIARLAKATRDGTATRDELSGSTLTVTSLGPLGGIAHTPVINHPEVAIIGPNKIVERPVVRGGQIVARKMMNISASFDHRVVDGFDAASFIQLIKNLLENPATLFMP